MFRESACCPSNHPSKSCSKARLRRPSPSPCAVVERQDHRRLPRRQRSRPRTSHLHVGLPGWTRLVRSPRRSRRDLSGEVLNAAYREPLTLTDLADLWPAGPPIGGPGGIVRLRKPPVLKSCSPSSTGYPTTNRERPRGWRVATLPERVYPALVPDSPPPADGCGSSWIPTDATDTVSAGFRYSAV
jgi:hypothetical protein